MKYLLHLTVLVLLLSLSACHLFLSISQDVEIIPETCGNGMLEVEESCDGTLLSGGTCVSRGFDGGELSCSTSCRFDLSLCTMNGVCGDAEINVSESCDGANLNNSTCITEGFDDGDISCSSSCILDTTSCIYNDNCGDGSVNGTEECDGTDLGDSTCENLGYYGGQITCSFDCNYDISICETHGICGDGIINSDYMEECDGSNLDGDSCNTYGLREGVLSCNNECRVDTSGCGGSCGDGILQIDHESCDGTSIPTCIQATGERFGVTSCNLDCSLNTDCFNTILYGSTMSDIAGDITYDQEGNLYVVGFVGGDMEGQTSINMWDMFITKVDPFGTRLWTKVWGTSGFDYSYGVAVDSQENVYLLGTAQGGINGESPIGNGDVVLIKLNPGGTVLWTRMEGTSEFENGTEIAIDSNDNIYITGHTQGDLHGNVNAGNYDVFIIKYDVLGNRGWTTQFGSSGIDYSHGIVVDGTGSIYVAGYTAGPLNGITGNGGNDIFTVKLNSSGTVVWTRLWGTNQDETATSLAMDSTNSMLYVSGSSPGSMGATANQGGTDAVVIKVDFNGIQQWIASWGSSGSDSASSVAVATSGLYVIGSTDGDLGGVSALNSDLFITTLDSFGNVGPINHIVVPEMDWIQEAIADPSGGIIVSGGASDGFMGLSSNGYIDIFLHYYISP
jgi:Beta-propeller repeat